MHTVPLKLVQPIKMGRWLTPKCPSPLPSLLFNLLRKGKIKRSRYLEFGGGACKINFIFLEP